LDATALVLVNSRYTESIFSRSFPSFSGAVRVLNPCVAADFLERPASAAGREEGAVLQFLSVARLSTAASWKNIDKVLRGLARYRGTKKFCYRIVGDGDLRAGLEQLSRDLGLADEVVFLGALPRAEVLELMDSSDLFLLPSEDSFGIVYVEAAARGLPSLVSSHGGADDAYAEGVTAIVIPAPDPALIAEGVDRFLRHRDRFDSDAMKRFASGFSAATRASELVRLFAQLEARGDDVAGGAP
jgi:phosphatidylinositol alpha-1,6-mannosyltransferase